MRTDQSRHQPLLAWDVIETRPGPYVPIFIAASVWWMVPILILIDAHRKEREDDLLWVVIAFFLMMWVIMLLAGTRNRRAWRAIEEGRSAQPTERWAWEYPWQRELLPDRAGRNRWRLLAFVIPAAAMLAVFNGFMHADGMFDTHGMQILLLNVAFALLIIGLVYIVAQGAKYRRITLRLPHFPLRVGESTTLMLENADRLRSAEDIRVRLRCVEQHLKYHTAHGSDAVRQVIEELLGVDVAFVQGEPLRITIPADAPGTQMLATPPVLWELAIDAKMPGIDYRGRFLLPVYEGSDSPQSGSTDHEHLDLNAHR